ncbi:MAG: ABC transporter substrate-binding protein [Alphaproteobacteria bacterium]|nr:ABC transporter substrate-binding protein [Alphaproteobacteria bacterium]MDA7983710.1 ABC transporter substrate-binding protein [Alphaproteobacteria bacterium]MDA7985027.1 ABC transporter substrate-binding protein [Alphaproteobacteria bacterium]MDA7987823.1 ABC transporter substrate-binding protein [Alphaproteobacteria bacterium]MDA7989342.1 ABC transporter substrate-binding protein [Alphaproteobacteria bacterium]
MSAYVKFLVAVVVLSLGVMVPAAALAQSSTITVYTAYEEDEAAAFLELAKQALPDIEVNLLRLSTGDLAARIIAESGNPQHDVLWGFAASTIVNPDILSGLEAYTPADIGKVAPQFRDPGGKWFAPTGYMAAFCVNEERLSAKGLPRPTSWADLLDPVYRGEIVMPNPASSGTGFIQIDSILQMKGEEAGWAYLTELDKNIAQYIKSGSRPCHAASAGEYAVGASFGLRAIKNIDEGFPITMVIPSEGSGNELEANGLVAASRNKDAAKRFLDWTLTEQAATEYYAWKGIVTIPGGRIPQNFLDAGLPEDVSTVLFPVDFQKAGAERTRIIETWQSRFER